jgi:hypothetical protein
VAGANYFELRLSQMHLLDRREYWREFIPVASFATEFLFAGERRIVPFVVGPQLLAQVEHVRSGDSVEYLNRRIAGPYPYAGDDVNVFSGLFRVAASNWAKQSLSLVENVAKAFDVSKLTAYLDLAAPLVDGLEGLLAMDDVEPRLSIDRSYTGVDDDGRLDGHKLRAGYEVIVSSQAPLSREEQSKFRVRDGRLFRSDPGTALKEYTASDYMVLEIRCLDKRDDYEGFDFHQVHWRKVLDHIWGGHEDDARARLRLLAADLVQCDDLVLAHRRKLLTLYKSRFEEEVESARAMFDGDGRQRFDSDAEPPPLDESDLGEAVLSTTIGEGELGAGASLESLLRGVS